MLAQRTPWANIEASLAPLFARKAGSGKLMADADLFDTTAHVAAGGCGQGSYFPEFLESRRTAEKALTAIIQETNIKGLSTRWWTLW